MAYNTNSELRDGLLGEFAVAETERANWEGHWEEVAKLVYPSYSGLFTDGGEQTTAGSKKTQYQYDSTAAIALPRFAAVMESMLTPRNTMWHRLIPTNQELLKDRDVQMYYDAVVRLLFHHRYAPRANFSSQNHQNYLSLGSFGTGCVFTDANADELGLRYRAVHLGEMFFFENHQGVVDKAFRRFRLSARQAAKWFGADTLPECVKRDIGTANQDVQKHKFLHVVMPREDREPQRLDGKGKPILSVYLSIEGREIVRESGYNTFPYSISRYVQAPGEIYGRSPAMEALPAIKTLNEEKKTMLKQGHRQLDPVLLLPDDGVLDGFSLKSGSLNWGAVNADGRPLVHTLPTGNLAVGDKMMEYERAIISDAFLMSLFQILTEGPQMTATEVIERVREKGVLLSPTMGRQQSEYLGPLIERELDLLAWQGLLPPRPPVLEEAGAEYKVMYDSPLSRAQRAEEAAGFFRLVEFAKAYAVETQNPAVLDWVNIDEALPAIADIQAVPPSWLRSMQEVIQIREGRAQQMQEQQQIEAAPAAAGVAKAMADINQKGA
jgi:hypothetical protein